MQPGEGFDPKNQSGNASLFLNQGAPPEGASWQVEIPIEVERDDTYQVLMCGLTLYSLVPDIRWSSPFAWSIDGGPETVVDGPTPAYRRTSGATWTKNQRLNLEDSKFTGNGDVYWELGRAPLKAGRHAFVIRVLEARPSGEWIANIEAIVLRSARGLPPFDAPPKTPPAPPIPAPLSVPTLDLVAADKAAGGKTVAIENGDFETPAKSDDEKLNPPGWKRDLGAFTYNRPYQSHGGKSSIAFFPDKKRTQSLVQAVPTAKINAALGRKLQAGDKLVLSAWIRHYWEEGGLAPKTFALGIQPDAGKDGGSAQAIYAGSSALDRDWRHVAFVYTVSQNDVASDAAFWKIVLRVDAQAARSMVLWDDVALRVRAK